MPSFSVIVPACNSEATIGQCLEALTKQSVGLSEYEVIVVDDGSKDGTADIIKRYPVRYIHQQNAGPAAARNRGAREAEGEIVLFTDSDCVPSPTWVEEMAKPFNDPAISAVKGAYKTNQKSLTARFCQVEFEERFEMLKKADSIDMVDTYSAAFRRGVFWGAGGFDEAFPVANNEDTELSYKLSSAGHRMVFNPNAFVYHLKHPDTPWKYMRQKFWRGYWRMFVYRRFPDKMMKDTYTPKSLKFQSGLMLLVLGFILLMPASRLASIPFVLALGVFMATTVPFTAFAMARDPAVGFLSPFFLALRGLSIGLGVLYFFVRGQISPKKRAAGS